MYYPYLRGRKNELIAVRNFSENLSTESKIFPVIEPVRKNINILLKTMKTLRDKRIPFGIVLNPEYGEFHDQFIDLPEIEDFFISSECYPVFLLSETKLKEIKHYIDVHRYEHVMFFISPGADIEDESFQILMKESFVTKVIVESSRRRLVKTVRNARKEIIELSDNFISRPTNLEYVDVDEEMFTEEPFYYKEDQFDGFSDYTTLPNEFREGGSMPRVVAIHLTYRKSQDQIFIKHFCSDSNRDLQINVQGKFAESAQKAIEFFHRIDENDTGLSLLEDYIIKEHFPGLGVIKKISVLHHLELIQKILS